MTDKNNLIYEKSIYTFCKLKKQCTDKFMIALWKYRKINKNLTDSAKVRYLFFNKLCNEVEANQLESFLNYHFDNSHFYKEDFLRVIKLDVTQLFHRLVKPVKIKRGNEPGIVIPDKEIPFFAPYVHEDYLKFKIYFDEFKNWIKRKEDELSKLGRIPKRDEEMIEQSSIYTVKSILLAYYYMHQKKIYPIPELATPELRKKDFYLALEKKYGKSYNSFKNDWQPLKDLHNRLSNLENIKLAIKLLETFDYPKIEEAIDLAKNELNQAELKS